MPAFFLGTNELVAVFLGRLDGEDGMRAGRTGLWHGPVPGYGLARREAIASVKWLSGAAGAPLDELPITAPHGGNSRRSTWEQRAIVHCRALFFSCARSGMPYRTDIFQKARASPAWARRTPRRDGRFPRCGPSLPLLLDRAHSRWGCSPNNGSPGIPNRR